MHHTSRYKIIKLKRSNKTYFHSIHNPSKTIQNQIKSYNIHGIAILHAFKAFRQEFGKNSGGNKHQLWRTTLPQTSAGRRTPPPPVDTHHPPHTGLPLRSSSTSRTSSSSSDRRRSPRDAVGSGWRRNEGKKRKRGRKKRKRHVRWGRGKKWKIAFHLLSLHKPQTSP